MANTGKPRYITQQICAGNNPTIPQAASRTHQHRHDGRQPLGFAVVLGLLKYVRYHWLHMYVYVVSLKVKIVKVCGTISSNYCQKREINLFKTSDKWICENAPSLVQDG